MRFSRGVLLALSLLALVPGCKKDEEKEEAAAPAATCGKKPLPDCPTQKWMKEHMKPAFDQKDTAKLATALDEVAAHAPPGFTGWDTISKKGADAARAGDFDGVKAACKSCHDDLRSRFKKELRDKPLL